MGLHLLGLDNINFSKKNVNATYENIKKAARATDRQIENIELLEKMMIIDNKNFYYDYNILKEKLKEAIDLDRAVLSNVDDASDKTKFTLGDLLEVGGKSKSDFKSFYDKKIKQFYEIGKNDFADQETFIKDFAEKIMAFAMDIDKIIDSEKEADRAAITIKLEEFLGIDLVINYASTAFSATQIRNFFEDLAKYAWAALFLPKTNLDFILKGILPKINEYEKYTLDDENYYLYSIPETLEESKESAIAKFVQRIWLSISKNIKPSGPIKTSD